MLQELREGRLSRYPRWVKLGIWALFVSSCIIAYFYGGELSLVARLYLEQRGKIVIGSALNTLVESLPWLVLALISSPLWLAGLIDVWQYLTQTKIKVSATPGHAPIAPQMQFLIENLGTHPLRKCSAYIENVDLYPLLMVHMAQPWNLARIRTINRAQLRWNRSSDPNGTGKTSVPASGGQAELMFAAPNQNPDYVDVFVLPDFVQVGSGIITFRIRLEGEQNGKVFSEIIYQGYFTYIRERDGSVLNAPREGDIPQQVIDNIIVMDLPTRRVSQITIKPNRKRRLSLVEKVRRWVTNTK